MLKLFLIIKIFIFISICLDTEFPSLKKNPSLLRINFILLGSFISFNNSFRLFELHLTITLSRLFIFTVESRLKGANRSLHAIFSLVQRVRFFRKFSHIRVSLVFTLSRLIVFTVGSRLKGANPSLHDVFSLVQRAGFFPKLSHIRVS